MNIMASGVLDKLIGHRQDNGLVDYEMELQGEKFPLKDQLEKNIEIQFTGEIYCQNCTKVIKKTYAGGFCFPCSQKLACADFCILSPEKCHFDKGTCREPEWAKRNCFIPTIVYLANSSNVKVGLTRETQIPTRWIDQGAVEALPIFRLQNRKQAGVVESMFKGFISDKTNFRKMLKNDIEIVDLKEKREELFELAAEELDSLESEFGDEIEILDNDESTTITYPVVKYPEKVTSLGLDKNPHIQGRLLGIKGQYFILDNGVVNIRKHIGYKVDIKIH